MLLSLQIYNYNGISFDVHREIDGMVLRPLSRPQSIKCEVVGTVRWPPSTRKMIEKDDFC